MTGLQRTAWRVVLFAAALAICCVALKSSPDAPVTRLVLGWLQRQISASGNLAMLGGFAVGGLVAAKRPYRVPATLSSDLLLGAGGDRHRVSAVARWVVGAHLGRLLALPCLLFAIGVVTPPIWNASIRLDEDDLWTSLFGTGCSYSFMALLVTSWRLLREFLGRLVSLGWLLLPLTVAGSSELLLQTSGSSQQTARAVTWSAFLLCWVIATVVAARDMAAPLATPTSRRLASLAMGAAPVVFFAPAVAAFNVRLEDAVTFGLSLALGTLIFSAFACWYGLPNALAALARAKAEPA